MANTLTIRGNLTKAPEDNPHGENRNGAYVFFTLAENRKNSDGEEVDPFFHRIAAYGRVAENFLASNTPKGTRLMAEVRIGYEDVVIVRDDKEYDDKRVTFIAQDFGPCYLFDHVSVEKEERSGSGSGRARSGGGRSRSRARSEETAEEETTEGAEGTEEETTEEKPAARRSGARSGGRSRSRTF